MARETGIGTESKARTFKLDEELRAMVNRTPFYTTIDMELISVDQQGSVVRLRSGHKHGNLLGTVHGGAIASLLDTACSLSLAPFLKTDEVMITICLNVDYLATGSKGNLTGRGRVVHRGKRLIRAEAVITDETRKMIAKGSATLIRTTSHRYVNGDNLSR